MQYVQFTSLTNQISNAQEDSGIKTIDMNNFVINFVPVPEFYTVDGIFFSLCFRNFCVINLFDFAIVFIIETSFRFSFFQTCFSNKYIPLKKKPT